LFTRNYERCQFYANKFLSIRTDNEIVYLDDDFKRGVIKFINENYCESERRELLLLYNAIFKMTNVDDKLTDYEKRFMFDDISK